MKRFLLVATLLASAICSYGPRTTFDQLYCNTPTISSTSTCWVEATTYYL
jgi:hypothetical protein